jgi:hypothetical protein
MSTEQDKIPSIADFVGATKPAKPRSRVFTIQNEGDPSKWSLDRLDEINAAYKARFGTLPKYGRIGQGSGVGNWRHERNADFSADPDTPEGQFIMDWFRQNNLPFRASTVGGVQRNAQGRIISTGKHIHAGPPSGSTRRNASAPTPKVSVGGVPSIADFVGSSPAAVEPPPIAAPEIKVEAPLVGAGGQPLQPPPIDFSNLPNPELPPIPSIAEYTAQASAAPPVVPQTPATRPTAARKPLVRQRPQQPTNPFGGIPILGDKVKVVRRNPSWWQTVQGSKPSQLRAGRINAPSSRPVQRIGGSPADDADRVVEAGVVTGQDQSIGTLRRMDEASIPYAQRRNQLRREVEGEMPSQLMRDKSGYVEAVADARLNDEFGAVDVNSLPADEKALALSNRYLTPQSRALVRGAASTVGSTASTVGNLLEPLTWIDKGWQGLMGLVGIESADGPMVQAQQAARRSSADILNTVERDRAGEVKRYGAQPIVNQVVEGGTQMGLDLATKYNLASKAIAATGAKPTADKVMMFVNGVDRADKGAVETALGMGEGYVRGKALKLTEPYGVGVNVAAQGGGAGIETYLRTGDVRQAASEAVLQGGMGVAGARGKRRLRDDVRGVFRRPIAEEPTSVERPAPPLAGPASSQTLERIKARAEGDIQREQQTRVELEGKVDADLEQRKSEGRKFLESLKKGDKVEDEFGDVWEYDGQFLNHVEGNAVRSVKRSTKDAQVQDDTGLLLDAAKMKLKVEAEGVAAPSVKVSATAEQPARKVIRHSDPNIDGGEILGSAGRGRLRVRNNSGGISTVQDPRRTGNREAAIQTVKEDVNASENVPASPAAKVNAAVAPEISQAFNDWNSNRGYVDARGNYHVKEEGKTSGPIASWNKQAKAQFKNVSEFHEAARKSIGKGISDTPRKESINEVTKPNAAGRGAGAQVAAPPIRERSFPKTAERAGMTGGEDKTYEAITNKDTLDKARASIRQKGVDRSIADLAQKSELTAEDTATGIELMRVLQNKGEHERAANVASDLSKKLTEAGQAIQAASIVSRLSPEGVILTAQKQLKPGQKLTPEQSKSLVESAAKLKEQESKLQTLEQQIAEMSAQLEKSKTQRASRPRLETLQERLTKAEGEARARLEARKQVVNKDPQAGTSAIPLDIADYAIIGAAKLARKGITLAQWNQEMLREFGKQVEPHLRRIYTSSYKQLSDERARMRQESQGRSVQRETPGPHRPEDLRRLVNERLDAQTAARKARQQLMREFDNLNASPARTFGRRVVDILGLPRAAMTTLDLSWGLRQGKMALARHPLIWGRGFINQLKALSPQKFDRLVSEIEADPDFKYMQRFKIGFTSEGLRGQGLGARDESFQTELADRVPGVAASGRAYSMMADTVKAGWFKDYLAKAKKLGFDPEKAEDKAVFEQGARLINDATGRSALPRSIEGAAPVLNNALFSPRFWVSRVKMLTVTPARMLLPERAGGLTRPARVEAFKTLFAFTTFVAGQMALAKASGASISFDPDDKKFMKACWGDHCVDFSAGFQGHIKLAFGLGKHIYESKIKGVRPESSAVQKLGTYARGKESPNASFVHDVFFSEKDKEGYGKDITGQSVYVLGKPGTTGWERIKSSRLANFSPMVLQDALEAYEKSGLGVGASMGAGSFFGESTTTYREKAKASSGKSDAPAISGAFTRPSKEDKSKSSGSNAVSTWQP